MKKRRFPDPSQKPLERVIEALERGGFHPRFTGSEFMSNCPSHEDRTRSLSIREGEDGRALVHCHAGCPIGDVLEALGLTMTDLFPPGPRPAPRRQEGAPSKPPVRIATVQPSPGCTLAQYAAAKHLPSDFLAQIGLRDCTYLGAPAVRIPYFDCDGVETAIRFRLALDRGEEGDNRFRWRKGARPGLYGLWRLANARESGYVVLVEGESDAQTLWVHGIPALGLPGANSWKEEWALHLEGIPLVYVIVEPDAGGQATARWLSTSSIRERVRQVSLGELKDPSGLFLAGPDVFGKEWQAALDRSTPWASVARDESDAIRSRAWTTCGRLAAEPDILETLIEELARAGLVGEARAAKLIYLAVTSRLLDRPVSLAVKGPSSAGKSYVLEKVLEFFPTSAYYMRSAMSERAMLFSEEPLVHRMLVLVEAAGLQGEFASFIVRSLLSEGRLRYETVDKTKEGLRPRIIEREGPTGLLVTTTALRLHPENETRLFSVPVSDAPEQTRQVMLATAQGRDGTADLATWHALQEWLARSERRVVVPFAGDLARAIPPVAVRLRRDFGSMLNLIRAHAILHQVGRQRDEQGRILACLEDYAAIRELVADLLAEGVEVAVAANVRQTVEAVREILAGGGADVTVQTVALALGMDKSSTWRRVQAALNAGYLRNLEERRGRPARLVLDGLMQAEEGILPPVERLGAAGGCTVACASDGKAHPPPPAVDSAAESTLPAQAPEGAVPELFTEPGVVTDTSEPADSAEGQAEASVKRLTTGHGWSP